VGTTEQHETFRRSAARIHPPHGATVDEHRYEHEGFLLGGVFEKRLSLSRPR